MYLEITAWKKAEVFFITAALPSLNPLFQKPISLLGFLWYFSILSSKQKLSVNWNMEIIQKYEQVKKKKKSYQDIWSCCA